VVVFLLIVVAIGYTAAAFVPPYWAYLSMMDPVKEAAFEAAGPRGEESARKDLLARAVDLGVPLDEEGVQFSRVEAEQIIRVSWDVPVSLPIYQHTLHFQIEQRSLLR
jgi:hypothetical protein